MTLKSKNRESVTEEKREHLEELYRLISANSDRKNAFFDVKINKENPKDSKIIANRPGVELFAIELMKEMEEHYDESTDVPLFEVLPISVGKWCKKKAKTHFTELEVKDFYNYRNSLSTNDSRSFWDGLFSSLYVYSRIAIYILALFGGVAVLRFCTS